MILVILLNKESKTFTVDSDCYEALVNVYFERTKEFIKVTEGVEDQSQDLDHIGLLLRQFYRTGIE